MAREHDAPFPKRMRTGLRTSVVNNSSAFAFSIMITGTFGVIARKEGPPTLGEVYLFGMAALAGFAVLEAAASNAFRRRPETFPVEVTMVGASLSFLAVAVAFSGAVGATALFDDTIVWGVGPFAAAALFTVVEATVMALMAPYEERWVTQNRRDDPHPEPVRADPHP